jgi:catechol 2,3-dioxygenase-like lactoylglutathione lyase family enzyme
MGIPAQFGIVTLGVSDLDRSSAFYEALGWERCASSNESICWFRTTGSYVGLFPYESLAADADLPTSPREPFRGVTLAINVESEEAVGRALNEAATVGGEIIKPAQRAEWGGYSGYFTDPDGYPWEVAFNPNFELNEGGRVLIP